MLRIVLAVVAAAVIGAGALALANKPASPPPAWRREGQVVWTDAPDGRIKARVYASARRSTDPVLVVWLHGDLGPG